MTGPSIQERLEDIRRRIREACRRSGREPGSLILIGASKKQSVERLRQAWDAGLRIFGENRVQETAAKREQLPGEARWHLLGPLQSNKARAAVELFESIHSLDRLKIARVLERHCREQDRRLEAFLEVNLGAEESKHGFLPDELPELSRRLAARLERVRLVGLMAIPPLEEEAEAMRPWFRRLRELRDGLRRQPGWEDFPGALSMGMSQDFEVAVEEGATHVRIGTALFGPRPG